MDTIDKKILCELDANCRVPISILARKLRIGRNVVAYRIKNLQESGILKKQIVSLNLGSLGYKTYKIYFKLNHEPALEKKFAESLKNDKRTIHFLKTEGSYDYSVAVAVKTVVELDEFLTTLKSSFSSLIKDYFVSIVVFSKIFKLNKLLLGEVKDLHKIERFATDSEPIILDDIDKKILKELSQNANESIVQISQNTKISIDIIKYRLKKLQEKDFVSYRILFDTDKMGLYHYVCMLKMRALSKEKEEEIATWASLHKKVLYITKRIGNFDFEINFAIHSIDDLNKFIEEVKILCGESLDSYELILNRAVLKLNYAQF